MQVIECCTQEVVTLPAHASIGDAAHRMHIAGVGCLVVVDEDEHPVGMVTDRDLCLRAIAPNVECKASRPIVEVMSAPAETLDADCTVDEAVRHMRTLGIRRMPILRDGALAGLVALDDLLAVLADALHDLAVEGLERRRRAHRDGRSERAREELESLRIAVRDRMRKARWSAQESLFEEIDDLRERARRLLGMEP